MGIMGVLIGYMKGNVDYGWLVNEWCFFLGNVFCVLCLSREMDFWVLLWSWLICIVLLFL